MAMNSTTLLSVPTSHQKNLLPPQRPLANPWSRGPIVLARYPTKFITIPLSSSSSSSTSIVEDTPLPPPPPPDTEEALPVLSESLREVADNLPLSGCKGCGREEIEKGCNGEGRIQGGIATVPGFGWWPIKAYRPCPGFLASGGRYRRQGQSMDEVVSGRGQKETPKETGDEVENRKKKRENRGDLGSN